MLIGVCLFLLFLAAAFTADQLPPAIAMVRGNDLYPLICLLLATIGLLTLKVKQDQATPPKIMDEMLWTRHFFQQAFSQTAVGMLICDLEGYFLQVNDSYANLLGYANEELISLHFKDITHTDDLPLDLALAQTLLQGEIQRQPLEKRYIHKNGHVIWVLLSVSLTYDTLNRPLYFIGQIIDISERKQHALELQRWQDLFRFAKWGVVIADADNTIRQMNPAFARMHGYSEAELIGLSLETLFAPQVRPSLSDNFKTAQQLGHHTFESLHIRKGGEEFPVFIDITEVRGDGQHAAWYKIINLQDISARKLAEQQLIASEARSLAAERIAQFGSWEWDIRTGEQIWSAETYRIFGYLPAECRPSYDLFMSLLSEADKLLIQQSIARVMAGAKAYQVEYQVHRPDGAVRYVQSLAEVYQDQQGLPLRIVGTNLDITEKKLSLSNLRESNEKLRSLFMLSPLGIVMTNMAGEFLEFNNAFMHICGYTQEELQALDYWQLTPKKYYDLETQQLAALYKFGQYGPYEKEYVHKDGSLIPIRLNGILLKGVDGQNYIWSIVEEISLRQQAEQKLLEKKDELRNLLEIQTAILDALPAEIALINQQGVIQTTNQLWKTSAINNLPPCKVNAACNHLETCNNNNAYNTEPGSLLAEGMRQVLCGEANQFNQEYPCHDPLRQRWYSTHIAPLATEAQHGAVIMHIDITENRLADEQLQKREQEFRALVENSPDVIIRFDKECHYLYANPAIHSLLGIPAEEYIGKSLHDIGIPKPMTQHCSEAVRSVFAYGAGRTVEFSDRARHYHARFVPEYNQQGHVTSVLVLMRDITESKNFELELQQSRQLLRNMTAQNEVTREQERKHIAREVHDELGQTLTALRMGLSLLPIHFGASATGLTEKVNDLLGLVDQGIQNVRNVAANLRPIVLDMGIVPSLQWLCKNFSEHTQISCKFYAREETVDIEENRAINIFRIVQESLTNVARYAEATQVDVSIERIDSDLRVKIRDNGKGFDPGAISATKSFGLLGIRERAIALNGHVDIISNLGQGTVITLTIPN